MGKTAFVFSGQGAQYIGMAKDVYENFSSSREFFEKASRALGYSIENLIFNGTEEELKITENTQPAILTASMALAAPLIDNKIMPDITAGLSIGEYTALVFSGAIDFPDCIELVRKRGRYMQEAVPVGEGTMAAVIGLDNSIVLEICEKAQDCGIVEAANFNCPGQVVVAGEVKAVEEAVRLAQEAGAKRAVLLNVSGPFHCSMLEPAAKKLALALETVEIKDPLIPVLSNVTARYHIKDKIKEMLVSQVMSSVRWEDSIRFMISEGVSEIVEIGPGKVLTGFIKRIDKTIKTYNIENLDSLNSFIGGRK